MFEDISVDKETKNIDILHPWKLAPGEQVTLNTRGTVSGAILFSLSAITGINVASIGAAKALHGEFEIKITRLGDKKVMVGIHPTQIHTSGVFLILAKAIGVSRTKELLKSMQYNYVFDFDKEDAESNYHEFIETGKIPYLNHIADFNTTFKENTNEAVRVLGSFKKNQAVLDPKGIHQTYFSSELARANKTTTSMTASPWHFFQATLLKAEPTIVVSNGDEAVEFKNWQMEVTKDKFLGGNKKEAVYASVKTSYRQTLSEGLENTNSHPENITLRADFIESKIRKNQHNQIVDDINTVFGRVLDHYKIPGHKEDLKIHLERVIRPVDIENLLTKQSFDKGETALHEASIRTGISVKILSTLIYRLSSQGQDERAVELMNFVHSLGKDGLRAFAAIHILLGGNSKDLIIESDNCSQNQPVEKALEFRRLAIVEPS
jgi:hypothetical protein